MKKSFTLEGLDCANCAAKIEEGVAKIEGVSAATVSFATTKLTFECDSEKVEEIVAAARAIVKRVDAEIVMK